MSRRIFAALIGAVCFPAFAGCATNPFNVTGNGPLSSGAGTAAQVVKAAQATCQFVPTAATIAGIVSSEPTLSTAEAIASAICKAVAPLASGPGSSKTPGYVGPVRVRGHFTG